MSALLDTGQIASLLNCSREYVTDKLTKKPGFPKPVVNHSQRRRLWKEWQVMEYLKKPHQQAAQPKRAAMSEADSR